MGSTWGVGAVSLKWFLKMEWVGCVNPPNVLMNFRGLIMFRIFEKSFLVVLVLLRLLTKVDVVM